MNRLRVSDCELGPIRHRPSTRLLPAARCARGHRAPRYIQNARCVVCAKIDALRWAAEHAEHSNPGRLRRFAAYDRAVAYHERVGGYLLCLGEAYGVTTDDREAARLRGEAWVNRCDRLGCWDEVELTRRPAPSPRGGPSPSPRRDGTSSPRPAP